MKSLEIINPASYPKNITIKDLLSGSHPRNLFLFSMMQQANLVEKVGSGIKRINDAMNEYKLDKPLIEYENIWFRIVFSRPDLQQNSYQQRMGVGKGVEKISRKQRIIIDLIKQNPSISKKMIEKQGDISRKSVEYNIKKLKKMGLLKRVGPAKGGYWKIMAETP